MRTYLLTKKLITVLAVLSLFLTFNLPLNVSASFMDGSAGDGLWYDDFTSCDDIEEAISQGRIESRSKSVLQNSTDTIILEKGRNKIPYDCSITEKKDSIEAWELDQTLLHPDDDDLTGIISTFLTPSLLVGSTFTSSMYTDIAFDDEDYAETVSIYGNLRDKIFSPIHQFRVTIDEEISLVENMEIRWIYGSTSTYANLKEISMYVWTYGSLIPHWKFVSKVDYPNIGTKDNFDLRYYGNEYISENGEIDFIIIGTPVEADEDAGIENAYLRTNYINVTIEIGDGYYPEGYVISSEIDPDSVGDFSGWENLVWEGSRPSSKASVKIQVLDEDNKLITDLDGNEEGFTSSPIDLSSIDPSVYTKIKIKAILESTGLDYTPKLYNWGVTWQTSDGFYDSFTNDFRIGEFDGAKNDEGSLKISQFYGDWPIFGKNSANTRSYYGLEASRGTNETYWQSKSSRLVGGDFRSPVVSNGKVYIASEDTKIYSFNVTTENPGKTQEYDEMISNVNYVVDCSPAVSGEYLVFGTSKASSTENKVYALNSSNLSQVKWTYDIENGETICYSSAPTIANDRVFITSWSGMLLNNPLIAQLYMKIKSILGMSIWTNNKLIVLDLNSGDPIWTPVELSGWSFSTPAVDNGIIYVGCENVDGPSLYAFDEDTGEELWNQSIGFMGKSAPVVADTSSGKIVFATSRQQELFAINGDDKLFAFDAETGKMLWNVTIGQNTTSIGNVYKSLFFKGIGFNSLMATSSPISTPAYHNDILYAMSLNGVVHALDVTNNGKEIWNYDVTAGIGSVIPSYNTASPVVVDETIYVAAENGHVYALDINDGTEVWEYTVEYPLYSYPPPNYVFASLVVANGLIFISANEADIDPDEGTIEVEGRLYCVGDHSTNTKGKVFSKPIHVQKGKWWNEFDADINITENNTIVFSILDTNNNILKSNLNGTDNNISDISTNEIILCAEFTMGNTSEAEPVLKSWEISWSSEEEGPVFVDDSFEPGEDGWVNDDLPECSIEAYDAADDGLLSGIDTGSAKFLLEYMPAGSSSSTSEWFDAVCDGQTGVEETRIRAKISDQDIDVSALINITFKVKDLAGNEATSETITFKRDNAEPYSFISSTFEDTHNSEIIINVEVQDEGDEGQDASGVSTVTLKYKNSTVDKDDKYSDWKDYKTVSSPFDFTFDLSETMTSGYYKVTTIATDKAGNVEEGDISKTSDSFLFDMTDPEIESMEGEFTSMVTPSFNLEVSDDFELDAVYYRADSEADWTKIDLNIGKKLYSEEWAVPEDYWRDINPNEGHYIFFKAVDACGNELTTDDTDSPYIIKDENITEFYVDVSDFAEMQLDEKFTITANVPDDVDVESVALFYKFSEDSDSFEDIEWKQYGQDKTDTQFVWEFTAEEGNGYYKFFTRTTNTEGSSFDSPVESVKVSIIPTTSITIMILVVLLLVAVTIFVIRKLKKKEE